ncbi:MAG: hypothetical protein KC636_14355, partial [Myxococcales bacterium]|nr:hypothetical protein [Myxococcales bacterium]
WRPLLELLCTTSDPPTWSHALSFAVHRVARDDVSRAAVSEWLLDHVFLRGPLSEIEGMRSLLEYNVCASRDDEDSNAASSEARVQALFDQVIEPALRQRFDAARSDRQQLTILEVLTHLDRVRPDDRAYAACVTKHAAHDDPELRAIAWELADRLLVTLLEHLAPWLTELAQGDADDVHWLLQQSYALPDELLRVTLQAGIGRALTNKGALFWAAWQLLERTPGDPQAWAVVEQCLAAGPPRRVLVIATLWIKHGRPSDPIRRMLIEVGRDGSPEEQLGAAFALHQLLHEHERAHELALRVLERTSSSDEARMVALCLVAAGVERRALIRLILELPTAPHRDSSRLAFAVLLRLGRGVEPLPLPEPSRFDEFWIYSIMSDVIRPTLAEIDRTLGFRTLHSSAFGAKLAKIPDDQLPKELASVLAELVDEHAHELHRALTRCSAAHRDHELLARAVIGQPEDALAQRIARAWVYAKIDRQRARADVRTTRAARRP